MDENNNVIVRVPEQQFIKGEDGYSPEVTIENIEHGHSVTITDRDHPTGQSFNVMDGDSAYEQAVAGGYTKSEAQFNAELGSFGELSEQAADSAAAAAQSESNAAGSATTATTKAQEAADSAAQALIRMNSAATSAQTVEDTSSFFTSTILPNAVTTINNTRDQAVANVNVAKSTAVQNVQAEGTTQISAVQTESTTQQAAIQQKGEDVLDSIPADYTELTEDVSDLKSATNYNEACIEKNDSNFYDLLTGESIQRSVYPVWESGNWSTGGGETVDPTKIRSKEIDFDEYFAKYTPGNTKRVSVEVPDGAIVTVIGMDANNVVTVYRGLTGPVIDTQGYPLTTKKIRIVAFYSDRRVINYPDMLGDTISMNIQFNTDWRPLTTDDYHNLYEKVIDSNVHLLPSFHAVVGREWNLYFCQLFEAVDWKTTGLLPRVDFNGNGGRMYDDRYSVIATSPGNFSIRIKILKIENGAEVEIYNSNFLPFIVYANTPLEVEKKALFIGDSRTDFSRICTYAKNQLGSNLTLLGTRGESPYFHEGRTAWSAKMYCTLASRNDVANAFWNPATSKFDFGYYMSQQSYSSVDFVNILLGVNGEYSEEEVTYLSEMVNSIHSYNSAIKVSIMTEYQLPISAYYTGWYLIAFRSRLFFNRIKNQFGGRESENIYIVPAGYQIDNYYDFATTNAQVSQLNTKQMTVIADNVHCTYGYDKISNAWLMFFVSML